MSGEAYIVARSLSVDLGGRRVLNDVSLSLSGARLIALVGPNGAGKTTLLRSLAGLLPSEGGVLIGGDDLSALDLRTRAQRIAYLPQGHIAYWPLAVRDIVALGRFPHGASDPDRLSQADSAAVARAMEITEVMVLADRPVTELSGGERARVALARVLAVEAPAIFADEPIASLDPRYRVDVMKVLRRAADDGALVVVVTHDLGLAARFADEVLVLDNGNLAAQGTPDETLTSDILARVFRVDAFRASHQNAAVLVPWDGA